MPKRKSYGWTKKDHKKKAAVAGVLPTDEDLFAIEKIVKCRQKKDKSLEFLIRWKDYDGPDSWEPKENLTAEAQKEAEPMIDEYFREKQASLCRDDRRLTARKSSMTGKRKLAPEMQKMVRKSHTTRRKVAEAESGSDEEAKKPRATRRVQDVRDLLDSSSDDEAPPPAKVKTPSKKLTRKSSRLKDQKDASGEEAKADSRESADEGEDGHQRQRNKSTIVEELTGDANEKNTSEKETKTGDEETKPAGNEAKAHNETKPAAEETRPSGKETKPAAEHLVAADQEEESDRKRPARDSSRAARQRDEAADEEAATAQKDLADTSEGNKTIDRAEEGRRLRGLWTLIEEDLKAKVSADHPATLDALSKLYPAAEYPKLNPTKHCVFCHSMFDSRLPKNCRKLHSIKVTPLPNVGDDVVKARCENCEESWEASSCYISTLKKGFCFERTHCSDIQVRLKEFKELDSDGGGPSGKFDGCQICSAAAKEKSGK